MQHDQGIKAAIAGIALLVGGAGASLAQGLPGGASSLSETHGDWTVTCTAPENIVGCAITQSQMADESRQRVLAMELRPGEDGEVTNGILLLPFGLRLDDGVRLAIDDDSETFQTLRFSTCLPAGCLVPLSYNGAAVSALRAGSTLFVKANASDNGQEIRFSISLDGFISAHSRAAELGLP